MFGVALREIETVAGRLRIALRDARQTLHRRFTVQPARVLGAAGAPHEIGDQSDHGAARSAPIGERYTGFPPRPHDHGLASPMPRRGGRAFLDVVDTGRDPASA